MNLRNECPYCYRTYTPYHRKQKACSRPECQKARQRDGMLERKARQADAAMAEKLRALRKNRQRRLTDRQRRQEARR